MKARFLFQILLWASTVVAVKGQETASDKPLTLHNGTGSDLTAVYVSASDAAWGENQLRNGRLQKGKSVTLLLKLPGTVCTVDVLAESGQNKSFQLWEINVCVVPELEINQEHEKGLGSQPTVEVMISSTPIDDIKENPGTVTLLNRTGFTIEEVYISDEIASWGPDRLGDETMNTDRDRVIDLSGERGCLFFIRALDEDGDVYSLRNQDLCKKNEIIITLDEMGENFLDPPPMMEIETEGSSVEVQNGLSETVSYLFTRVSGKEGFWGEDLLGEEGSLASGDSKIVSVSELTTTTCVFDLKATNLEGNRVWMMRDIDLCTQKKVEFTDEMLDNSEAQETEGVDSEGEVANKVEIENRLRQTIFYLHVRQHDNEDGDWGGDRLQEDNALSPRERVEIVVPELYNRVCLYDIRGLDLEDREILLIQRVDFCANKTLLLK
ncbi:MAG TPA: hypothetical protein DIW24_00885 [Bacteroidetes bacterium]|nr:hypothetical protein [Bacteroidota bacterium]HRR07259.1 hypothetical protein [Rhodothermales bacterium]